MIHLRSSLIAFPAILLMATSSAIAQSSDETPPDLPVPARLSVVEGRASFWRPGDKEWSPAQVNMALVAGDALATGERTNIEIQIGSRDFVRLMATTQLSLIKHENNFRQFRVAAGNASFDLRGLPAGQRVEIDAPNAAFVVDSSGYYRVDVSGDTSRLTVRYSGHALLALSGGRSRGVVAGEEMVARGAADVVVDVRVAPAADSWDQWNHARTEYYAKAGSNRYLPPEIYGGAELDQYGSWRETADYGPTWVPAVASGWTPYSTGGWRWDPLYEWTWVDLAPWGWATMHYGRWLVIDGHWAWAPGPRVLQPVYLPATVAFYGPDGDVSVDVTPVMTGVSWVALGWGEPVVPWWGRRSFRGRPWWGGWGGPRVINNIVIRHHDRIDPSTIRYRNHHVRDARPGEHRDDFGHPPGERPRLDHPGEHRVEPIRNNAASRPAPVLTPAPASSGGSAPAQISVPVVPPPHSTMPRSEPRFTVPAPVREQPIIVPRSPQGSEPMHVAPANEVRHRSGEPGRKQDDDERSGSGGHGRSFARP